jgi:hypothetical protein
MDLFISMVIATVHFLMTLILEALTLALTAGISLLSHMRKSNRLWLRRIGNLSITTEQTDGQRLKSLS